MRTEFRIQTKNLDCKSYNILIACKVDLDEKLFLFVVYILHTVCCSHLLLTFFPFNISRYSFPYFSFHGYK